MRPCGRCSTNNLGISASSSLLRRRLEGVATGLHGCDRTLEAQLQQSLERRGADVVGRAGALHTRGQLGQAFEQALRATVGGDIAVEDQDLLEAGRRTSISTSAEAAVASPHSNVVHRGRSLAALPRAEPLPSALLLVRGDEVDGSMLSRCSRGWPSISQRVRFTQT